MKRTRRTFLKLLAAGSAAVATRPVAGLAATHRHPAQPPKRPAAKPAAAGSGAPAPPPGLHAEIERQKRDLDKVLKTLRDYPLPPGSDPAFGFAPLRAERKP